MPPALKRHYADSGCLPRFEQQRRKSGCEWLVAVFINCSETLLGVAKQGGPPYRNAQKATIYPRWLLPSKHYPLGKLGENTLYNDCDSLCISQSPAGSFGLETEDAFSPVLRCALISELLSQRIVALAKHKREKKKKKNKNAGVDVASSILETTRTYIYIYYSCVCDMCTYYT